MIHWGFIIIAFWIGAMWGAADNDGTTLILPGLVTVGLLGYYAVKGMALGM